MTKTQYFKLVAAWAHKYGVPNRAFKYDPTEVKTCCEKCYRMYHKMARHHKQNDFFFALWWPDLYAARYIAFEKADTAKLCEPCHKSIERYSQPLKDELYEEFGAIFGLVAKLENLGLKDAPQLVRKLDNSETMLWAEKWKSKFQAHYDKWLTKSPRRRKKSHSAAKHK